MSAERFAPQFQIKPLPIIGQYNLQRFKQWSPEDAANWYVVKGQDTKRPFANYPTMGRSHINYLGVNELIFPSEPRELFNSIDYIYVVVGNTITQIDSEYNQVNIGTLKTTSGNIYFTYLVVNTIIFSCFVDSEKIYVYQENTGTFNVVTDPNAPGNITQNGQLTKPGFIAAFGNRITVSIANSSQFFLSVINLLNPNGTFDPAHCFSIGYNPTGPIAGAPVFAQESSFIRQMGVLNTQLYIFTDYNIGIWANTPTALNNITGMSTAYFPWRRNTTYDWNFGIADPLSLDISFNRMTWLAQNNDGLLQVMASDGGFPERLNTQAIDVLFQRYANNPNLNSPFLEGNANGFLYQYENTIFYRLSAGKYFDYGILDQTQKANSIEYNFETGTWHRCIELNGERCRIQKHVFFNNIHLVTLYGDGTIYQMSGSIYTNDVRNVLEPNPQAQDAYLSYPFRYERITPIISQDDYSEFETEYVEIDFVFGDSNISYSTNPFANTVFVIDEIPGGNGKPVYVISESIGPDGQPVYVIAEQGNTPGLNETIYNDLYKPSIELYWSDDGGKSFLPADVREFSQMGQYQWKMRWYQLGCSRNRVYKLIGVSPVPIVILGGAMNVRRVSGGAN